MVSHPIQILLELLPSPFYALSVKEIEVLRVSVSLYSQITVGEQLAQIYTWYFHLWKEDLYISVVL